MNGASNGAYGGPSNGTKGILRPSGQQQQYGDDTGRNVNRNNYPPANGYQKATTPAGLYSIPATPYGQYPPAVPDDRNYGSATRNYPPPPQYLPPAYVQPTQPQYFGNYVTQVPVRVEVPVEKVVEVPRYIDRYVDRVVERPVEKIVKVPQYFEVPVPVERVVPVHRRVEVPVKEYVEVRVPVEKKVPVPQYVDRIVDRVVEKPVDRVVTVEKTVEKIVEVPVPPKGPIRSVGIGLSLERADWDKTTYVERVVKGFAAALSGRFEVGDEVVSINGVDVQELSIGTIKQLTIGPEGTEVSLEMLRGGMPYSVTLTRRLPTHTNVGNSDAAQVLVHYLPGPPDGRTLRISPAYSAQA